MDSNSIIKGGVVLIKEHIVIGDKYTTFHNFTITQINNLLKISKGGYYQNGKLLFKNENVTEFDVSTLENNIEYEIWLSNEGFVLLDSTPINTDSYIDRLVWFKIDTANYDDIQVNILKIINDI